MNQQQRLINLTQAAPVKDYPWLEAAQTVDPSEAFYGSGFENMLKGQNSRGDNRETRDYHGHRMLAAALAANRVPLAGLGFDPHHESFDDSVLAHDEAGHYDPVADQITTAGTPYVNYPGSVDVHEALHRGNAMLRSMGMTHISAADDDELGVRVMMADLLGDPERFDRPQEYTQMIDYFNKAQGQELLSKELADQLGQVNQAAARAIALRRPGGPR